MKMRLIWQRQLIAGMVALGMIGPAMLRAQEARVEVRPTDTAAWALARYAVNLKYSDLPPAVVAITERHLLDALGCAYGAYDAPAIVGIRRTAEEEGGTPEATIIGSGRKTNVVDATWANSSMIRYMDYSDTYWSPIKGYVHPSDSIGAALAVAERQHASGKDLILDIVLGYEIQGRLADTFKWGKFSPHSAAGFAGAVEAGKLLHLTPEQMANAIGLGASHDFVLAGVYGMGFVSDMKAFGYAAGSGNGVFGALLAQQGVTGPVTILESFDQDFMNGVPLTPLLAQRNDFTISKTWLKRYEFSHDSEPAIEATIDLVKKYSIKPDQVASVWIKGLPEGSFETPTEPVRLSKIPVTKEDADHDNFYAIAAAIANGALGPEQYALQQWKDQWFIALMHKITFETDLELTEMFPQQWNSIVTINMKDGHSYTQRVDLPIGGVNNPWTDAEINAKFNSMALKLMPKAQADKIIDTVYHLDKVSDVSTLMRLLVIQKQ